MDAQVIEIGEPDGLFFRIRWNRRKEPGNSVQATRGELQAWLDSALIWGNEEGGRLRGLEWSWVELLEHLARSWRYLLWEQGNPLGLAVYPDELRGNAEREWRNLPAADRDIQERALFEYEETHNLAYALDGLYPNDLWVARDGKLMVVASDGRRKLQDAAEVIAVLERLGEEIFKRLRTVKSDPRAKEAMTSWRKRSKIEPMELASVLTGLSEEELRRCGPLRDPVQGWELDDELNDNELLAAARMIGAGLPNDATRKLMQTIRRAPLRDTPDLDELAEEARAQLQSLRDDLPHDQGTAMARWLREQLELSSGDRLDVDDLLNEWGVDIVELDLGVASIDAVGSWGRRHGPRLVINRSGRHTRSPNGRRTTLAHELCHLLLDRDGALPLAEVIGGRTPPDVEPRARAFAAELLLPLEVAGEQIASASGAQLQRAVNSLTRRYRVSRELVAWQARNSGIPLPRRHRAYLQRLVSEPHRF